MSRVHSVEALLSALECCGVDNARIEIEGGDELPVCDGSAAVWAMNVIIAGLQPALPAKGGQRPRPVPRQALKPSQVGAITFALTSDSLHNPCALVSNFGISHPVSSSHPQCIHRIRCM